MTATAAARTERRPALASLPSPAAMPGALERLRLVPQLARDTGSARWIWVVAGIIALATLAQLCLSIAISQGAYRADELEAQQVELARQQSALEEQLSTVESPQNLTSQATALGMVASSERRAIDPATGQTSVVGGPRTVAPNPALITNEALDPTQPNAANPNVVPAAPVAAGVSSPSGAAAPVPSVTELASPTTR